VASPYGVKVRFDPASQGGAGGHGQRAAKRDGHQVEQAVAVPGLPGIDASGDEPAIYPQ
jgi:hypothetical protein